MDHPVSNQFFELCMTLWGFSAHVVQFIAYLTLKPSLEGSVHLPRFDHPVFNQLS